MARAARATHDAPKKKQLFGIDKLNVVRSDHPGGDPCRLFGAGADGAIGRPTRSITSSSAASTRLTGCPVIVNTSFNVRSEPIVCTPEDAFRCFMGTELDLLVAGDSILYKQDQDASLRRVYKNQFELD